MCVDHAAFEGMKSFVGQQVGGATTEIEDLHVCQITNLGLFAKRVGWLVGDHFRYSTAPIIPRCGGCIRGVICSIIYYTRVGWMDVEVN